jgi:splicing suppressor protein 51
MNMALGGNLNPLASELLPENDSDSSPTCEKCTKPASPDSPLKLCSKCKSARYCSRECQKADWKAHKQACRKKIMASDAESRTTGPEDPELTPGPSFALDWENLPETDRLPPWDPRSTFHTLWERDADRMAQEEEHGASLTTPLIAQHWMGLSEETAFSHIIDAYRLRVEDEYTLSGNTRGIYNQDLALPDFRRFLDKAEKRKGLLPLWWSEAKRRECEKLGRRPGSWTEIDCAVEKHDIAEHYKDASMPTFLRLFAEKVELRDAIGLY